MEAAGYKLPANARQLPPAVGWAAAPAQDAAWEDSSLDSRLSTCESLPAPAEASSFRLSFPGLRGVTGAAQQPPLDVSDRACQLLRFEFRSAQTCSRTDHAMTKASFMMRCSAWRRQYAFVGATMPAEGKKNVAAELRSLCPDATWLAGASLHQAQAAIRHAWRPVDEGTWLPELKVRVLAMVFGDLEIGALVEPGGNHGLPRYTLLMW